LTCAFAGRIAVHKKAMMSDEEEIRDFIGQRSAALPSKTARRIGVKHCGKTIFVTKSNAVVNFHTAFETYATGLLIFAFADLQQDRRSRSAKVQSFRETGILQGQLHYEPDSLAGFFSGFLV
jgi:hypothetical protein